VQICDNDGDPYHHPKRPFPVGERRIAGFMTSESFPRDGGVEERRESIIMRSSDGEGALDAGDSIVMGGRVIGADGLACDA
jgi:hypothetical protein